MSCDIRQVTSDEARQFWLQQGDARIFLHPDVLEPLCERVDWWLATWNGNPVCLWPMCHDVHGNLRAPELSSYVGPLWHDYLNTFKANRWWSIARTVQLAFLEFFVARYSCFMFELPPGSQDIRVFQWFGNENAGSLTVEIQCRHTAIMDLKGLSPAPDDESGLLANFSRDRVKDIRRLGRSSPFTACIDPEPQSLYSLYEGLLAAKQARATAERRGNEVATLVRLARSGFGQLVSYQDASGVLSSFSIALHSKTTSVQVISASTESAREKGLQAWIQHEVIANARKNGIASFDFLGANSVVGADEKHRYGGWPAMYFSIRVVPR